MAWINLWQAMRENGFPQFVRWQSQMGRKKRENTQTKVQSEHQGEQKNETKVQSEHQGGQKNETKVKSEHQGEQKRQHELIPYDTWVAGWEALKRNGFPEFVRWTQLGKEEKRGAREPKEVSADHDSWQPPWGKKDSMDHKMEMKMDKKKGEKIEQGKRDSREPKVVYPDHDLWQPPWGKKGSMDHKMDIRRDKEEGDKMEQGKINPREPKAVSADRGLGKLPSGKRDSMGQKTGMKMDQEEGLKMESDGIGEVLDSLEELDTIEELEVALQDYYDSIAYEEELEGEPLELHESEKQPLHRPSPTIVKLTQRKEQKPWGNDYDNYEDYYYEQDDTVSLDHDSWLPPWGKKDSVDNKLDIKLDKEAGDKMGQGKRNSGEPKEVSADHELGQPLSGKMDSMDQKVEVKKDQKKGLKMDEGSRDSREHKTILLDHDSWHSLMKGLKIQKIENVEQGTGDSRETKTISLDHDLWQTLMQKGQPLAVEWKQ